MNFYTPCVLGLLLMYLGSHMFDCPEDAKLALRFSFTANDPALWKEVHRFAGWLWMLAGLAVEACTMLAPPDHLLRGGGGARCAGSAHHLWAEPGLPR